MIEFVVVFIVLLFLFILGTIIGLKNNGADWGFWLTNAIDGWARILCKRYHRQSGDNFNLPKDKGGIVVANHITGLDPFVMISASDRPLRFLIAEEEYSRFGLTWMFKLAKCIPVDRSGRVDKAFREAIRQIKAGEILAMFPHGKIHLDDDKKVRLKPGLRKLAQRLQCPVYAGRITGLKGPGDVFAGIIVRGTAHFKVFETLLPSEFDDKSIDDRLGALLLGRVEALEPVKNEEKGA